MVLLATKETDSFWYKTPKIPTFHSKKPGKFAIRQNGNDQGCHAEVASAGGCKVENSFKRQR